MGIERQRRGGPLVPPSSGSLWLLGSSAALADEELGRLQSWVENGGFLIVAPRPGLMWTARGPAAPAAVLAWLGLCSQRGEPGRVAIAAAWRMPYRLRELWLPGGQMLRASSSPRAALLDMGVPAALIPDSLKAARLASQQPLRAKSGVVAVKAKVGRGTVIALASAAPLANSHIAKADNVLLAASLLAEAPRPLIFWEGRGRAGQAAPTAGVRASRLAMALMVISLAIVAASAMQRVGTPRPLFRRRRRSVAEYIDAVAQLYQRAGHYNAALAAISRALRRKLIRRLGAGPDALMQAAQALGNAKLVRAVQLLQQIEAALGEPVSERQFVALARRAVEAMRTVDADG